MTKFRMWWRSAITGRFMKQQEAEERPDTTVSHKVKLDEQSAPVAHPWDGKIWYPLGKK